MKRILLATWLASSISALAQEAPPNIDAPAGQCIALKNADLSGVQDAPAQVTDAKLVRALDDAPAYCHVTGSVTQYLDFEMRLPASQWNGRFLVIPNSLSEACGPYTKRGYACMPLYRSGKKGRADKEWVDLMMSDHKALLDGGRNAHILTLTGKAIVDRFYRRTPEQSYLMGCSAGGYTALLEAQKFPWDFDGIIVVAADTDLADWLLRVNWSTGNLRNFGKENLQLLHDTALRECDLDDGVRDGIIGNPVGCRVRPRQLLCKEGQKAGCLTPSQIEAAERIYAGPGSIAGQLSSRHPSVLPGSEMEWAMWDSKSWAEFSAPFFQLGFYGAAPAIDSKNPDFDRDFKRGGLGVVLAPPTNPDLRKFKAAGGKLLAVQGANDSAHVVGHMIDYYELTEKTMGGRALTQEFFRFFMVPGMNHCAGGAGAWAIDYLTYLEEWVEKGKAPDSLIGAHLSADTAPLLVEFPIPASTPVAFTRPMYPYPLYAKYKGGGDPKDASSFVPVNPGTNRQERR